jgi:5'-deoxynucleotidase YfbR-like HD superfamily hydrolase
MGVEAAEAFAEYEAQESAESRFVRYLDKLDMALQAEIYEGQNLDLSEFKMAVDDW